MRKTIIIAVLVLGINSAFAQSKTTKIASGTNWEFKARITQSDTTYLFLFRNCKYKYIVKYESFYMDKDELEEFYESYDDLFRGEFDDYTLSTGVNLHNTGSAKCLFYNRAYVWLTPIVKKKMLKGQLKTKL